MSTPTFGQPSPFGASAPPPAPLPVEEPPSGGSNKTVVIAVAAGVVALGVLGGAAALVLGSGGSDTVDTALPPAAVATVEPSAVPSTAAAPLPTAAVQARNVFLPLVETDEVAAGGAVVDPIVAVVPTTAAPTASASTPPVLAPLPLPVSTFAPVPVVTQTVPVPGPVVIETVPGPTVTATTPGPVQTIDRFAYSVEVVSVSDPDLTVDGDSSAVFRINGTEHTVAEGDEFLDVFLYEGYEPAVEPQTADIVSFYFGSSLWSVPTGTVYGLGPR